MTSEPQKPAYEAEVEALWSATKKPEAPAGGRWLWSWRLSPALPSDWPMKPTSVLRRYVYGAAFDPQLRDGERVGTAFATVDAHAGRFETARLADTLELLGTQGVRPISKEQLAVMRSAPAAGPALLAGDVKALRESYCQWRSFNGVIAKSLEPRHEAFFRALACT